MNKYLSNKLTFFSFWLIVFVVLLHSLNIDFSTCNNLFCNLQYLLSHKLSQIAVPLFFIISGYLYFHKLGLNCKIRLSFFVVNNKKRIRSVLVPYILWCTLWFLFMYIIQCLPAIRSYFPQPLHEMSTKDKLLNLYYYPLNYPFWFLRELLTLFVISPLIFLLVKYLKWLFLILIIVVVLMLDELITFMGITLLSATPFFYFGLGAFFTLLKTPMRFNAKKVLAFLLIVVWLLLNIISLYNEKEPFLVKNLNHGFQILKDTIGCLALWYLYDLLNRKKQWKNYQFYNYSFFIFAFHGIPTLILVKISMALFKDDALSLFISYMIIVPSIIMLSIVIGMVLKKILPNFYNVLVGSRK